MASLRWRCRDRAFELGERTLVMGICNVTPDSFSDGGALPDVGAALAQAERFAAAGAGIVDVGGESTRPGAAEVPVEEELRRVVPAIERIVERLPEVAVSIDTRKAEVASRAVEAGAHIVNDVSAGGDPEMFPLVAEAGVGYVAMHMLGDPTTMQDDPRYDDVVEQVRSFLAARIAAAEAAGVDRERCCVDPGIGFGKTLEHNLTLLRDLPRIADLGLPVLVGPSRKRFIGALTEVDDPADRFEGTAAAVTWSIASGAHAVRVHDVERIVRVVRVADAIRAGEQV